MVRVKKAAKTFKRKPRVEYVEVGSDEVREQDAARRLRGPLRGLNPNNVLSAQPMQASIDLPDDKYTDENARSPIPTSTGTRALRHVKVEKEKWDMKYHVMDEVMRPRRTAKRRSESRSLSQTLALDVDSDEESEQSTLCNSDGENDSSSSSDADDVPAPTQRAPDPNATRFSKRSEAQKPVNYSRKHHPQDFGLPGHQRRAREITASVPPTAKKRQVLVYDEGEQSHQVRQPRKKLKSLSSHAARQDQSQCQIKESPRSKLPTGEDARTDTLSTDDLVEAMIRGSQAPPLPVDQAIEATNVALRITSDSAERSSPLPNFDHWSANDDQMLDEGCQVEQTIQEPSIFDGVHQPSLSAEKSDSLYTNHDDPSSRLIIIKPYLHGYEPHYLQLNSQRIEKTDHLIPFGAGSCRAATTQQSTREAMTSAPETRLKHDAGIHDFGTRESNERTAAVPRTSSHTLGRTSSHTLGRSSLPSRASSYTLQQLTASSAVAAAHCASSFFEEALEVTEASAHLFEQPNPRRHVLARNNTNALAGVALECFLTSSNHTSDGPQDTE